MSKSTNTPTPDTAPTRGASELLAVRAAQLIKEGPDGILARMAGVIEDARQAGYDAGYDDAQSLGQHCGSQQPLTP